MNNIEINSAILESTLDGIIKKLHSARGIVDVNQIDICDGVYVPSKTYLYDSNIFDALRLKQELKNTQSPLELDMMIDWSVTRVKSSLWETFLAILNTNLVGGKIDWVEIIRTLSPQRVVLHHSSITDEKIQNVMNELSELNIEYGIGVHLDDDIQEILTRVRTFGFSYAQVMGIDKVGFGGQSFSDKTYAKIRELKKQMPELIIAVDGGVKVNNARELKEAGATRLASGSGIFNYEEGVARAVEQMRN